MGVRGAGVDSRSPQGVPHGRKGRSAQRTEPFEGALGSSIATPSISISVENTNNYVAILDPNAWYHLCTIAGSISLAFECTPLPTSDEPGTPRSASSSADRALAPPLPDTLDADHHTAFLRLGDSLWAHVHDSNVMTLGRGGRHYWDEVFAQFPDVVVYQTLYRLWFPLLAPILDLSSFGQPPNHVSRLPHQLPGCQVSERECWIGAIHGGRPHSTLHTAAIL